MYNAIISKAQPGIKAGFDHRRSCSELWASGGLGRFGLQLYAIASVDLRNLQLQDTEGRLANQRPSAYLLL